MFNFGKITAQMSSLAISIDNYCVFKETKQRKVVYLKTGYQLGKNTEFGNFFVFLYLVTKNRRSYTEQVCTHTCLFLAFDLPFILLFAICTVHSIKSQFCKHRSESTAISADWLSAWHSLFREGNGADTEGRHCADLCFYTILNLMRF